MVNLTLYLKEGGLMLVSLQSTEELMLYAAILEDDACVEKFSIDDIEQVELPNGLTQEVLPFYWRKYV